jgi:hypothetical protein
MLYADGVNAVARPLAERDFQRQVIALARLLGWKVYHPHLSKWSERGWPDLAMVKPPRLILAELKRDGAKATDAQAEWLALLGACPGVEAYLWRPEDWDALQAVLEGRHGRT